MEQLENLWQALRAAWLAFWEWIAENLLGWL